jgi:regulatory protein
MTAAADALYDFMKQASRQAGVQAALSLLSRSPHTRGGLRLKLIKRGFDQESITAALDRMEELGYLDDEAFAEQWVLQRLSRHPEGKPALTAALLRKGIDRHLAHDVIERLVSETVEAEALKRAIDKCRGRSPEKVVARLLRLGFTHDLIRRQYPELLE